MKSLQVKVSNNKVIDIFTEKISAREIKVFNLPIFASKLFISQIFQFFGQVKSVEFLNTENVQDLTPFYTRSPKIAVITASAELLLGYESYTNEVIKVSKKYVPDVTSYLLTAYNLPQFPENLVNGLLAEVENKPKPDDVVTDREIKLQLNKTKSYKFYKFQATEARQASAIQLRKNEEHMKSIIQEQKLWGWLGE